MQAPELRRRRKLPFPRKPPWAGSLSRVTADAISVQTDTVLPIPAQSPTPNHTISADLDLFPLGTRLKIDGIVYTVEDKGSSVKGNILDIFYSSHEDALAKGTYTAEVFLVED